jgi:HEAT repeat protein
VTEPKLTATDTHGFVRALSDPDPRVRTLAAIALEREGPAAASAIAALESALKDSDPSVREAAARAIGAQGSAAGAAVAALAAACQAPGQSGAVVRACLYALGSLGKSSVPALPAIRSTLSNPAAGWVAERVILDIEAAARK